VSGRALAFVVVAGCTLALAYAYARELATLAEIDWLESIPVLEHEPEG
jgi:hypothetical protein